MNFRLTMILAIVLVLIATVFVWTQYPKAPSKTNTDVKNALLSPQPKEVRSVSFASGGEVLLAFAKEGGKWLLTAPVAAVAEEWQVSSIADSLKGLTYKEKFETEASGVKSEDGTGVKSPKYVVEFTDDAGKKHMLGLGKRTVGGVYARLDGGKTIYLLDSKLLDDLDKDPSSFRTKVMAEVNTEALTAITLATAGQTVELSKQAGAEGKWVISKPIAARANKTVVDELLNELRQFRASGFTSMTSDMLPTGLRAPAVTVTAYTERAAAPATTASETGPATASAPAKVREAVASVRIGYYTNPMEKKAAYAALGDSGGAAGAKEAFTISAETFGHLNKELKDLRDPAITPVAVAEAAELSIVPGDAKNLVGTVTVKKEAGQWQMTNQPRALRAGNEAVGELLQAIGALRAIKFVDGAGDLKSIGLDPPAYQISLQLPLQTQSEVILIGKPETADKVTPVMRRGEPTVYLVQTGEVEKVLGTKLTLRDKMIESLSGDTIREIAIGGPGAKVQTLSREGTKWKIAAEGKTADADDVKIVTLLSSFTPVTAGRWVDVNTAGGTPDATVTVRIAEPPAPMRAGAATTSAPATSPATGPATSPGAATSAATATGPATGPATGAATGPATLPATLPASVTGGAIGPVNATIVTRTIKMWKHTGAAGAAATWTAVYEGGADPAWVFEPTAGLIEAVTKGDYAAVPAASRPAPITEGLPK